MEQEAMFYLSSLINHVSEYMNNPNSSLEPMIEKDLRAICAITNYSIFEPSSTVQVEFYVTLHNLLSLLESRSNLIWNVIEVLQCACNNNNAKQALIHTYKYLPFLARILQINLTLEKRIKLLRLLQELSYGIKIISIETHLTFLLKTLSQWVTESKDEEEITLALSVITNLCYKNPAAIYSFMRTVNTKKFIQTVLKTRGNINVRVQCCKILIIMDYANAELLDSYILDVATVSFTNIIPALQNEDVLLVRHIVDFFTDISQTPRFRSILLTYNSYALDVEKILSVMQNMNNTFCSCLVMEFLASLVKLKIGSLVDLYPLCLKIAMSCIEANNLCSKVFALIKIIAIDLRRIKCHSQLIEYISLSQLISAVDNCMTIEKNNCCCAENYRNFSELMQLLQELVRTPSVRTKVLDIFPAEKMSEILQPMIQSNEAWRKLWEKPVISFRDTSNDFYIHALTLTSNLAANNSTWLTLYTELLKKSPILKLMALKLFIGDSDTKLKILQLTGNVGFSEECALALARCMNELEPLVIIQGNTNTIETSISNAVNRQLTQNWPLFSLTQEDRLDTLLSQIEELVKDKEFSNISTSAIIELYESKLNTFRNDRRAMEINLEAANLYANSLQHRLVEINAQSNKLQQILFNTQLCLEGSQAEKVALVKQIAESEEKMNKSHSAKILEIQSLKKAMVEKEQLINNSEMVIRELKRQVEEIPLLTARIKEYGKEFKQLEFKYNEVSNKHQEMSKVYQETISKKDQMIADKDKEIASIERDIAALNHDIKQQLNECRAHQIKIKDLERVIDDKDSELKELSHMRDMIFQLTANKRKDNSV